MKRVSLASCLVMLFLTLPVVANVADGLQTSYVQAQGATDATGSLVGLWREYPDTTPAHGFTLEAARLDLETDRADPVLHVGATAFDRGAETTVSPLLDARVEGRDARQGARWLLGPLEGHPAPSVAVASDCMAWEHPESDALVREPRVQREREPWRLHLEDAATLTTCGAGAVRVVGNFTLALYEWDIRATTPEGAEVHWSGQRPSTAPGGAVQERRELVLIVEDGTLVLPDLDTGSRLFVVDAAAEVDGGLLLQHATGVMAWGHDGVALEGQTVLLQGQLHADLAGTDAGLLVDVSGDVEGVRVDGVALTSEAPRNGAAWVWIILTVLGVAGATWIGRHAWAYNAYRRALHEPVAPWTTRPRSWRERVAMGWNLRGRAALRKGRGHRARRWMRYAIRWAPRVSEHRAVRGRLSEDLALLGAALYDREGLHQLLEDDRQRAENALEAAKLCRAMGDASGAAKWLHLARAADAEFVAAKRRGDDASWLDVT